MIRDLYDFANCLAHAGRIGPSRRARNFKASRVRLACLKVLSKANANYTELKLGVES